MTFLPYTLLRPRGIGTAGSCFSRGTEIVEHMLELGDKHGDVCFSVDTVWAVAAVARRSDRHRELLKRLMAEGRLSVGVCWAGCEWPTDPVCVIRDVEAGVRALRALGEQPTTLVLRASLLDQYQPVVDGFGLAKVVLAGAQAGDVAADLDRYGDLGIRFTSSDAVTLRDAEKELLEIPGPVPMGEELWCPTDAWLKDLRERSEDAGGDITFETWDSLSCEPGSGDNKTTFTPATLPDVHEALCRTTATLLRTERILALKGSLGKVGGTQILDSSWKQHLEDLAGVYTGSGDHTKRQELFASCDSISTQLNRLQANVEREIAHAVDAGKGPEGIVPLVVFNPSTRVQSGAVTAEIIYYGANRATDFRRYEFYRLVDENGTVVASEEVSGKQVETAEIGLRFVAMDVPAMGYRTYYLVPKPQDIAGPQTMPIQAPGAMMPDFPEPSFAVDDVEDTVSEPRRGLRVGRSFKTGGFVLDVNEVTGEIKLIDRASGVCLLDRLRIEAREDTLETGPGTFSPTGRILPMILEGVDLAESGEVSALLRVVGRIGQSPVELNCRVYADLPFLDVEATVSWRDRHPAMLELCAGLGRELATRRVGRPLGSAVDGVGEAASGHRWLQARGPEAQVTFASERTAISLSQGEIRCPLLLSSPDAASYAYNKIWQTYPEHITYRFRVSRDGAAMLPEDLTATELSCQAVYDRKGERTRAASFTAFNLVSESVVVSSVRPTEDGVELCVHEALGSDGIASIAGGPVAFVSSNDGLSRVDGDVRLGAGEIRTIVLKNEQVERR